MMRITHRGFTMLELLAAVAILVIAITGLLAAFINCLLLNEANNNLVIAVNDAQYVLEQIKGLSYDNIDSYTAPSFTNLNNETISAPNVVAITSGLKEVTANVSWSQRSSNRSFGLSTRIAR